MSEGTGTPARIEVTTPNDTVAIRQLVPEDAESYFGLIEFDRAHLSQSYHGEEPDGTAQKYLTVEAVLESIVHPDPDKHRFGIWDGDTMVGTSNLTIVNATTAESGSWVGAEHKGHHYAARARSLLLEFAFNNLGLERVLSFVHVGNEASRKSVEKTGYELTGEEDGQWVFMYEREQWEVDKAAQQRGENT